MLKARGLGVRAIARELEVIPGTISRELRRNAATRGGKPEYGRRSRSGRRRPRPDVPRRPSSPPTPAYKQYVQARLSGQLHHPDGTPASRAGDDLERTEQAPPRLPTLGDGLEPRAISRRLVVDFPDDEGMRISHEAIYQALYIEGRGALKRELVACLRTGRALRKPRERARNRPQGHVTPGVVLSERPAEAEDRAVPGHWEGDLILGLTAPRSAPSSNAPAATPDDRPAGPGLGADHRVRRRAHVRRGAHPGRRNAPGPAGCRPRQHAVGGVRRPARDVRGRAGGGRRPDRAGVVRGRAAAVDRERDGPAGQRQFGARGAAGRGGAAAGGLGGDRRAGRRPARRGGAGPPRRLAPLPGRAAGPRRPAGRAGPGPARLRATGRADPGRSRVAGRVRRVGGCRTRPTVAAADAGAGVGGGRVRGRAGRGRRCGSLPARRRSPPATGPGERSGPADLGRPGRGADPEPVVGNSRVRRATAVPAELAATFPDLGDVARTGTSPGLLDASRRDTGNFGGGGRCGAADLRRDVHSSAACRRP